MYNCKFLARTNVIAMPPFIVIDHAKDKLTFRCNYIRAYTSYTHT